MATNNTLTLIQAVTVGGGGAASIDFTSIPQTYTDLVIKFSTQEATTGAWQIFIDFNGTSSNRSSIRLQGNGSSASSASTSNIIAATNVNVGVFGSAEMYIPNYAGSTNKSVSIDSVSEYNGTESYQMLTAGLWSNGAAITSIKLYLASGNLSQYSTAYLYGVKTAAVGAKATGGDIISQDANYYYHTFLSSGTFTPTQSLTADYLVVAGGAGGGFALGAGGGGAGGLRCTVGATGGGGSLESALSLTATAYTVTIGAGGGNNANGSNSVFSTITSTGGGTGGSATSGLDSGTSGGSGGGARGSGGPASGGAGTANQGYAGGGVVSPSVGFESGAGGGGAGAVAATNNAQYDPAGYGAVGVAVPMGNAGTLTYYAGGGAGQSRFGSQGLGGLGGGGASTVAGTANTGGGGGGNGGLGGSGIVVVRYAK